MNFTILDNLFAKLYYIIMYRIEALFYIFKQIIVFENRFNDEWKRFN